MSTLSKVDQTPPETRVDINPILVISYSDSIRSVMSKILKPVGVDSIECSSFVEAEHYALTGFYSGVMVELPTMIKSKGEEKIVAYSLTNFYPTLRVRVFGDSVVPMILSGEAKQANNIKEFIEKVCSAFPARKLRTHKRYEMCLPVIVKHNKTESRSFTINISWGGVFIVDLHPEKFAPGDQLSIHFQEFGFEVDMTVCQIRLWGQKKKAPGIGLKFNSIDEKLESALFNLLRQKNGLDKDRIIS